MSAPTASLRVAVPPSLGALRAATVASQLGTLLRRALAPEFLVTTATADTYEKLELGLLSSSIDLAWAPAMACAHTAREGGAVLLTCVRGGATTSRAGFVSRADRPITYSALTGTRAAWVDPQSTNGYLLPRQHLLDLGVDPTVAFSEQIFVGSYAKALMALVSGAVDLTATYCSSQKATRLSSGLDALPASLRGTVKIIGYTAEAPNDGFACGPALPASTRALVRERLSRLHLQPGGAGTLRSILDAERLIEARPADYLGLGRLLEQPT